MPYTPGALANPLNEMDPAKFIAIWKARAIVELRRMYYAFDDDEINEDTGEYLFPTPLKCVVGGERYTFETKDDVVKAVIAMSFHEDLDDDDCYFVVLSTGEFPVRYVFPQGLDKNPNPENHETIGRFQYLHDGSTAVNDWWTTVPRSEICDPFYDCLISDGQASCWDEWEEVYEWLYDIFLRKMAEKSQQQTHTFTEEN